MVAFANTRRFAYPAQQRARCPPRRARHRAGNAARAPRRGLPPEPPPQGLAASPSVSPHRSNESTSMTASASCDWSSREGQGERLAEQQKRRRGRRRRGASGDARRARPGPLSAQTRVLTPSRSAVGRSSQPGGGQTTRLARIREDATSWPRASTPSTSWSVSTPCGHLRLCASPASA